MTAPVTLSCIGRFHHFHLARQLEQRGLLRDIWTGYPRSKLRSEQGIPAEKLNTFPWIHSAYLAKGRVGLKFPTNLELGLTRVDQLSFDLRVRLSIDTPRTLIALSGSGLASGKKVQRLGGTYICDRGSSHIRYQQNILSEEYRRWGLEFKGVAPKALAREEEEYESADLISIPSRFVRNSFVEMGVAPHKLFINPYGSRIERFYRDGMPSVDEFNVLFVGQASLRKGFLYLLEAFKAFKHPRKKLTVIGQQQPDISHLIARYQDLPVEFTGIIANEALREHYSRAQVMVLPSIEEGLAMVIGEAMACSCPVIATTHTGAADFYEDGDEGYIVEPRDPDAITAHLERLADDPDLRQRMSDSALARAQSLNGWNTYGDRWAECLTRV